MFGFDVFLVRQWCFYRVVLVVVLLAVILRRAFPCQCLIRVSHRMFLHKNVPRLSYKNTRISHKSVVQEAPQECGARVCHKSVLPTDTWKSVLPRVSANNEVSTSISSGPDHMYKYSGSRAISGFSIGGRGRRCIVLIVLFYSSVRFVGWPLWL